MTGAYSAAKAALIMLCKQMALEWGEHGIRVNSVSPGMIMTPMTQAIYRDETIARQREAIVPLRRIGSPDDVARAVAFLIDPANRYITGENVMVDGGLTLSVLDRIPGVARRKGAQRPSPRMIDRATKAAVRIGVAGAGAIGRRHAAVLRR